MAALKDQGIVLWPWRQKPVCHHPTLGAAQGAVQHDTRSPDKKRFLRRAFADIDISKLPTVAEAKAQVKATLPKKNRKARGAHI